MNIIRHRVKRVKHGRGKKVGVREKKLSNIHEWQNSVHAESEEDEGGNESI